MLHVQVSRVSKRYLYEWIIKDFDYTFSSGSHIGIKGVNGSGKSTLLKMISGHLSPSEGAINYTLHDKEIDRDDVFRYVGWIGPYTDLVEEYSIKEMFDFHFKFKEKIYPFAFNEFLEIVRLKKSLHKPIKYYSSGMNQRLQLALAILTNNKLLLFDEPTSFLDDDNKKWFYDLLESYRGDRTIITASNDPSDFMNCQEVVSL